jgi:hypothetical protein
MRVRRSTGDFRRLVERGVVGLAPPSLAGELPPSTFDDLGGRERGSLS